jgi:serine/threonine protein kinase
MAPELVAGAKNAAPSSDIFSFGVIASELLTGRVRSIEPVLFASMHSRTGSAPEMPDVPAPIRSLIQCCLDRDPAKRPNATQVVATLKAKA